MRKKYAIDLGSSNSRLWESGQGLVIDEPTIMAVSAIDGSLVSIGHDAKLMLGKTPETLLSSFPVRKGAVNDEEGTVTLLKNMIGRVTPRFQAFGPDMMASVPTGATQVEKQALLSALLKAGASHAYLVDVSLASSIGAGIPVVGASGHMVVNFGADTTEAAILSLGGVVLSESTRVGSSAIDQSIATFIKEEYGLVIGPTLAETIKIEVGYAVMESRESTFEVSGRDLVYGLPRTITVNSSEITEVIRQVLNEIIYPVKKVLENIPPELASDIIEKGITMTGGGASLNSFDRFVTEESGIPSHVADDPALTVVRGVGVILENINLWKRSVLTK